jgi:hypothetical protein
MLIEKTCQKNSSPLQQYVVKAIDLVPMGHCYHVMASIKIKPSTMVLAMFRRIIAAREGFTEWYATGSNGNEAHQHFITVLEEALSIQKTKSDKSWQHPKWPEDNKQSRLRKTLRHKFS